MFLAPVTFDVINMDKNLKFFKISNLYTKRFILIFFIFKTRMRFIYIADCSIAPSVLSLFNVGSIRTLQSVVYDVIMNFKGLIRSNIKSSWKETFIKPMNCSSCNKIYFVTITWPDHPLHSLIKCLQKMNPSASECILLYWIYYIIFNMFNLIYLSFNSHLYCVITYI